MSADDANFVLSVLILGGALAWIAVVIIQGLRHRRKMKEMDKAIAYFEARRKKQ